MPKADQEGAGRQQRDTAIGQPPAQQQLTQLRVSARQKLDIGRSAGPVLDQPRAVDDACQPPGHRADHARHGGQQEHRRHGQLYAVGDDVGIQGQGHGNSNMSDQPTRSTIKPAIVCSPACAA